MMLRRGQFDSQTLLDTTTVNLALLPHTSYVYTPDQLAQRDRFYALHWTVYTDRYRTVSSPFVPGIFEHAGSDGTLAWADPAHDLILIYLTQSRGHNTRNDLLKLIYAAMDAG
jgi:CubicO group peptidase (beta-lactamase class C family)